LSLISKRWNVAQKLPDTYFDQFPHLPRIVVQILHNRGITQPDRIGSFLVREAPGETDPLLLKGMPETVARIQTAIQNDDAIAVYGDWAPEYVPTSPTVWTRDMD
jgi:single-stranded-DNA-specific exonuclease